MNKTGENALPMKNMNGKVRALLLTICSKSLCQSIENSEDIEMPGWVKSGFCCVTD
jgi:hypothetical protein